MMDDKEFWKDVTKAMEIAVNSFYDYLTEERGWNPNIAVKFSIYEISSDYEDILDELHYTNLGHFLKSYTTTVKEKVAKQ